MLQQLIYMSVSAKELTTEDLEQILEASRRNNAEKQITGLLVIKGRTFLQVLEGDSEVIKPLFQKLREDQRHREISIVSWETIENRNFPNWSMGFKNLAQIPHHSQLLDLSQLDISKLSSTPSLVHDLIQELLNLE
ncbi:MAG: hypothetical protein RIT27_817 [Pseudomonadota bacterium]|jgi:hypothetical protein